MPALGKEIERQLTPDEIALREVQGYIDKVEHQAETQEPPVYSQQQVSPGMMTTPRPTSPNITSVIPVSTKQKIILPLDQTGVEGGLKNHVFEGLRWLSEWCVMMIKKYPGRVFYMSPQVNR
ncbi:MAG: hypothetical protein UX08_C0004G0062 [Candidatus Collierbacteria bacterium GW2011_GWB1_45_35]|uniref:Uncharacterized protein n=2 Tax=Candidatus Collieribacteriota TaxID=1752725 RepID=A0A0G1N162_9BACT|nr:MAG: hypothetical protein UW48_C0002G0037 [Microgenomates group bacterium GW2011_GWC1_44_23]KKT86792.1 MAG: hypothetical protein UW84_C0001G0013 [Candidatus Collierbacteria bacterium GW2011_GWA2_44_99]KKT95601.1 MAG: hypothetical protein UW96_C0006G0032 [Candidatus Collierbacteria bacterium GW2011_GWA1_45_15]KKU00499.1 MAG: hypothetical protein UX01_C0004G0066 [Candidatus Collierbacteria bacterium GW2011_GWB2_45_17]KKU05599.1 MAG: hypothetical protein UX08_C0004G0062 [Candidatus Collierbacte